MLRRENVCIYTKKAVGGASFHNDDFLEEMNTVNVTKKRMVISLSQ